MNIIIPEGLRGKVLLSFIGQHPKTGDNELYLKTDDTVYELMRYGAKFGSWFVDQTVQKENSLFFLTRLDILYFAITRLKGSDDKFRTADDIFEPCEDAEDEEKKFQEYLRELIEFNEDQLEEIADMKVVDGDNYYKFNMSKALEWLTKKVHDSAASIKARRINACTTSASVASFDGKDRTSEADRILYGYELVEQYLPDDISQLLREHLGIKDDDEEQEQQKQPLDKSPLRRSKRAREQEQDQTGGGDADGGYTSQPIDDFYDGGKGNNVENDSKKPRLTRGQKALAKSAKGVAPITSFFRKK